MDTFEKLTEPKYWLLGIATILIALHLTVLGKTDDSELFATCVLFWIVIISLMWDKRTSLILESDTISTVLGALLIGLVLVRSLQPDGYHIRVAPFVSMLGLGLMASGFKGLRQYWKELVILSLLMISTFLSIALQVIDLTTQTAK
ncbi:MAG: archaeosortase/exosortase family protein, partial [Cyanobacteria bacterium]|nr:archaeosortase/exosortase family protein [Cyanobacteriota bacterium]MDW8203085.1 archaeosortase/exosortase family protein [Cyanobacteriota bacterium SKYGB_h_bin112]